MPPLSRNDPRQYDELADQWWRPGGAFELLHWLAAARAAVVPSAGRDGAVLVDVGCGGGLLAPRLAGLGYRHVGVDLSRPALAHAAARTVVPVLADAARLPLADACADVVVAGELLEHVPDRPATVAELCRVLRPGGLLVLDTLNATAVSRWATVTIGERLPGVPRGIHDPRLYVRPATLTAECARHGVPLRVRGLRPTALGLVRWLLASASTRSPSSASAGGASAGGASSGGAGRPLGRMVPSAFTGVLYQAVGRKAPPRLARTAIEAQADSTRGEGLIDAG